MKKLLLIFLVAILGIFGAYYYVTLSMVNVADDFFAAVKGKNLAKAETYLSKGFKKNTSSEQLAQYLVKYNMHEYKELSWGYKRIIELDIDNLNKSGKKGSLEGTIVSKDGVKSPIKLQFKLEQGSWKLFALEKVLSKKEIAQQKLLSEYTQLSRISMHYLGQAINDNNMSQLYDNISELWKKETSVKKLDKIYGVFVEKKINLLPLDKVIPKLTVANIGKNGLLTLSGYYLLGKKALYFTQKYVPENKVWKLAGLSIQIK